MSQYPATRTVATQPTPASPGIDLKTLLITAASSAAAAYTCSKLWTPGTLAAAACMPVLVAIIREGLSKSTAAVANAVPVRGVVRSATPEGPQLPDAAEATGDWSASDLTGAEQPPIGQPLQADDAASRVAQPGEIAYHGSGRRAHHWRMAIITGLLGFVLAAVLFTVPEIFVGDSAAGGGRSTTLFGGKHRESGTPAVTTTTETTTAPEQTVTTPQETVTVSPQTVTTPPPAVPNPEDPEQTTPPVPPTTEPPPPPVVAEPPPAEVPPG